LNGAITLDTLASIVRNADARWFIPSESEWYKAAYYDPVAGDYWNYATGTNTVPTSAPPGSTPNSANFYDGSTGFAVTGSPGLPDAQQNYLTDVGAYTASISPYGTFDQSGNIFQWNEASYSLRRGLRGGSWLDYSSNLPASNLDTFSPVDEYSGVGFRVATVVPEPSTAALAVVACGAILRWRRAPILRPFRLSLLRLSAKLR
jgi:formylglycine-generating enzyme required for sulfatase activity